MAITLRKVKVQLDAVDENGAAVGPLSGATVEILKRGAVISGTQTWEADGSLAIEVLHPGSLKENDNVTVFAGGETDTDLTGSVTSIVYSVIKNWWTITMNVTGTGGSVTVNEGDILRLTSDAANRPKWYKAPNQNGTSSTATLSTDANGEIVSESGNSGVWIQEPFFDLAVSKTGYTERFFNGLSTEAAADRLSVLDFGADNTGAAVSDNAFQDAIDFAGDALGKQVIYVPSGTYLLENTITLRDNVSLIGDGKNRTTITTADDNDIFSLANVDRATISGMDFTFSGARSTGIAIDMDTATEIILEDLRFAAPGNAIFMDSCARITVRDVIVTTAGTGGWVNGLTIRGTTFSNFENVVCVYGANTPANHVFVIDSDSANLDFRHCHSTGVLAGGYAKGFHFTNSQATNPPKAIRLYNCSAQGGISGEWGTMEEGFQVDSGTDIQFDGCVATFCEDGLQVSGAAAAIHGVTWKGGSIYQCAQRGIVIDRAIDVAIIGANIHNNSRSGAGTYEGININANADGVLISNCTIGQQTNYGTTSAHSYEIDIDAAADNYRIIGNRFKDASYRDSGTTTDKVISNNLDG